MCLSSFVGAVTCLCVYVFSTFFLCFCSSLCSSFYHLLGQLVIPHIVQTRVHFAGFFCFVLFVSSLFFLLFFTAFIVEGLFLTSIVSCTLSYPIVVVLLFLRFTSLRAVISSAESMCVFVLFASVYVLLCFVL